MSINIIILKTYLIFLICFMMPLAELRVVGMKTGTGIGIGIGTGTGYGLWYIAVGTGMYIGTPTGAMTGRLGPSVCVDL